MANTLWSTLREAVAGSRQDFTTGSISRAVLLLATPMVLEMMMESLFFIVDVFWVTRLGADAVATVGLTESMLAIVFSVALGVALSTTAMVARRIGEGDRAGAAVSAVQAIALGIGLSLLIGVSGLCFSTDLLRAMGASPGVVAVGHRYTLIVLGGNVAVVLLFINNAIFRGAGDASLAMRVLWFSNLINLLLDPCFIFGLGPFPRLGVTGAAVSTLIGRSCGVLFQFWLLTGAHSRVVIHAENLRLRADVILTLIRVSGTGVLQFLISQASWVALVRMVSSFGSSALAGYTIGVRIFMFVVLPAWGLSGAAATMVGQNLGAKKPERASRAVYLTGFYNTLYLGLISILLIFLPRPIVSFFTRDATIFPVAVDFLRIIGYGNLIYAFGMVFVQAFNGAGDTLTPTGINFISFWIVQVPLAWMLAMRTSLGVRGVFWAIPISQLCATILSGVMFVRGDWKRKRI